MRKSSAASLLALAGAALLLDPRRAFPLDDDWVGYVTVRDWLTRGSLRVLDICSPTFVAHAGWGGLFARAFGLGHGVLRFSTLCLAVVALLVLDRIAARDGAPEGPALASPSFLLAANPLFLLLSFTFMTDVPYLAWSLVALALYLKADETGEDAWWAAGSAAAAWAYLIRQLGVFLPLTALLFLLMRRRLTARRAALILAAPVVAILANRWWFFHVNGVTWAYAAYVRDGTRAHLSQPLVFLRDSYRRVVGVLLELSLFTLPSLVLAARRRPRWKNPLWAAAALLAVLPALRLFGGFPYLADVISARGLGAAPISGAAFKASGWLGSPVFARGLTLLSVLAAAGWAARAEDLAAAARRSDVQMLGLAAVLQLGASLLGVDFYDRYALTALPAVLLVTHRAAGDGGSSAGVRPAVALSGLLLLWSALGTEDWLNWKEAAWEASSAAVRAGVPASRVDGGYEWCGLYEYEENIARLKAQKPLAEIGRWEWVDSRAFAAEVTFDARTPLGWSLLTSVPYRTPLSRAPQSVYVYLRGEAPR